MFGKRELQQRMYRHCPVYNLLVFKSRFQSGDLLGKQGLGTYEIYFGKNSYDSKTSGMDGRNKLENSIRMRIISRRSSPSSSRMRLLASTTSAGSMNTVLPLRIRHVRCLYFSFQGWSYRNHQSPVAHCGGYVLVYNTFRLGIAQNAVQ